MAGMIKEVSYREWGKFSACLKVGPCVEAAFPQGQCFGLFEEGQTEEMAAMVWYAYTYRHCPWHRPAFPHLYGHSRAEELEFFNKNVRLLARVSTLPKYRHRGYAYRLVVETLGRLGVPFVECLTAWPDVRKLLDKAGFVKMGADSINGIDYWLWGLHNLP